MYVVVATLSASADKSGLIRPPLGSTCVNQIMCAGGLVVPDATRGTTKGFKRAKYRRRNTVVPCLAVSFVCADT